VFAFSTAEKIDSFKHQVSVPRKFFKKLLKTVDTQRGAVYKTAISKWQAQCLWILDICFFGSSLNILYVLPLYFAAFFFGDIGRPPARHHPLCPFSANQRGFRSAKKRKCSAIPK
jgi:hypothetical protein